MDRGNKIDRLLKAYAFSLFLHLPLMLTLFYLPSLLSETRKLVLQIDLSTLELTEEPSKAQKKAISHVSYKEPQESAPQKTSQVDSHPLQTVKGPEESKQEKQQLEEERPQSQASKVADATPSEAPSTAQNTDQPTSQEETKEKNSETLREAYIKEKLMVISSIVKKSISYPSIARRMGWEGKVVLIIHLTKDGNVEKIHVEQSSGYEVLDRNAVDTIRRVSYLFPKPPVDVSVKLPVSYRLE